MGVGWGTVLTLVGLAFGTGLLDRPPFLTDLTGGPAFVAWALVVVGLLLILVGARHTSRRLNPAHPPGSAGRASP